MTFKWITTYKFIIINCQIRPFYHKNIWLTHFDEHNGGNSENKMIEAGGIKSQNEI